MEALHRFKVLAVNVGFTELQPLYRLHRHIQIPGIDRGGQAIVAVIGHRQRLIQGVKRHHRQHRAKRLFMNDVHLLAYVQQQRRRIEIAAARYRIAAQRQTRPLR